MCSLRNRESAAKSLIRRLLVLSLDLFITDSTTREDFRRAQPSAYGVPWHGNPPQTLGNSHPTVPAEMRSFFISNVRSRITDIQQKPRQTVIQITSAVSALERWVWTMTSSHKHIETMQPTELDDHLATFFRNLRKPDGSEYDLAHLSKTRSYIERFLREKEYPWSITRSPEFQKSQLAFSMSKKNLMGKLSSDSNKRTA